MAQGFPSTILDSVLKQMESPILWSIKLSWGFRPQLHKFRSKLEEIRGAIEEAEQMGIWLPEVRKWLCELQDVLYEADDLLDEVITRYSPHNSTAVKVRREMSNVPFFLVAIGQKVKVINKKIDNILKEFYWYNLIVEPDIPHLLSTDGKTSKKKRHVVTYRPSTMRYNPDQVKDGEFVMIGRDDDKRKVIELLTENVAVLVYGEPGVGKTTLCRAILNDKATMKSFDVRLWIKLDGFHRFTGTELLKKIIRVLAADEVGQEQLKPEEMEDDELKEKIRSLTSETRLLLVLDNPPPCPDFSFYHSSTFWLELKDFMAYPKEIRILMTTVAGVPPTVDGVPLALVVPPQYTYELKNDLSENHSWALFKAAAFMSRPDHDDLLPYDWKFDLEKQIVAKCRGIPALLRTMGRLLYGKDDKVTWDYYARDFQFPPKDACIEIVRLYNSFPKWHHPIGYLRLFSEDNFKYETLNLQFAAHGFGTLSPTTSGFFQQYLFDSRHNEDNWDAMTDYAIKPLLTENFWLLSGTESIILKLNETVLPEAVRHVAITRPGSSKRQHHNIILPNSLKHKVCAISMRSLLFIGELSPIRMPMQTLDMLISQVGHLRVLDLHDLALQELPSSIGSLIHLRYLDLSRNDFKELPRSICRLKNLKTLRLSYCDKLLKFPPHLKSLCHLKHLEISMCLDLTHMPSAIAILTSLEKLDRFVVGSRKGGLRYLEKLNNLSGQLSIDLPKEWKNAAEDALKANLEKKKGLTGIEFKWQGVDGETDIHDDSKDVLEQLKPNDAIEKLLVINYGGTQLPKWITALGMENRLTEITISQCRRCEVLPPFHGMPKLKSLTLTSLKVEYIQDAISSCPIFFPSLSHLKIGKMPNLRWWAKDLDPVRSLFAVDDLPRFLHMISMEIWDCPCFTIMPPPSVYMGKAILQNVAKKVLASINWWKCNEISIVSFNDLVYLPLHLVVEPPMTLHIEDCKQLQMLWASEDLIVGKEAWESLSKYDFEPIRRLQISNCPAMKYLSCSLRHLIYMSHLVISKCSQDLDCLFEEDGEDEMPWKVLKELWYIKIDGFQKLVALPKGLRHHSPLCSLDIVDCKALTWQADVLLPNLKHLHVRSCPLLSKNIKELTDTGDSFLTRQDVEVKLDE